MEGNEPEKAVQGRRAACRSRKPADARPMPKGSRFKVIVFDCDGVLFDSKEANIAFYNHVLERFGRPPMSEEEIEYVHVATMEGAIRKLFGDDPRYGEALGYSRSVDLGPFLRMSRIQPNLKELLTRLKPNHHTAIATNRGEDLVDSLRAFDLEGLFDLVITARDVARPKPDPEALQRIARHFGVPPEEILFIGDSHVDGETARRAGCAFVAYRNESLEADGHIQDLLEILDWICATDHPLEKEEGGR